MPVFQSFLFLFVCQSDQFKGVLQNVHAVTSLVRDEEEKGVQKEVANGLDDGRSLKEEVGGQSYGEVVPREGHPEGYQEPHPPLHEDLHERHHPRSDGQELVEVDEDVGDPPDSGVRSESSEEVRQFLDVLPVAVEQHELDAGAQGADESSDGVHAGRHSVLLVEVDHAEQEAEGEDGQADGEVAEPDVEQHPQEFVGHFARKDDPQEPQYVPVFSENVKRHFVITLTRAGLLDLSTATVKSFRIVEN